MTDAEQIEAWRSEFIDVCGLPKDELIRWSKDSDFFYEDTENMFKGFCVSKRSQPVIELPKDCHDDQSTLFRNGFMSALKAVKNQLTAAGYKYKVKE